MILLLSYRSLDDVRVARFADFATALAVTKTRAYLDDPVLTALVVDTDASQFDLGSRLMVDLYNALRDEGDNSISKFENRTIARSRFVTRLESRFGNLPITAPTSEASEVAGDHPPPEATTDKENTDMPSTDTKEKKPRRKAANGGAKKPAKRDLGKPAGAVSAFKQVRDGSTRQQILKLMTGSKTPDQIAEAIGADRAKVMAHAYCLARDCGIGYSLENDKLSALYPTNRSYADAVVKAEKKTKAAKAE